MQTGTEDRQTDKRYEATQPPGKGEEGDADEGPVPARLIGILSLFVLPPRHADKLFQLELMEEALSLAAEHPS